VKVGDDGFNYNGQRCRSLSAIAKEITGTKWNGYLSFHLPGERQIRPARVVPFARPLGFEVPDQPDTPPFQHRIFDSLTMRPPAPSMAISY